MPADSVGKHRRSLAPNQLPEPVRVHPYNVDLATRYSARRVDVRSTYCIAIVRAPTPREKINVRSGSRAGGRRHVEPGC